MWKESWLPEGTVLHEKYEIQIVLGQGGFGITYLVEDLVLGRKAAVKEYFPAGLAQREPGGDRVYLKQGRAEKGQVEYHEGIKSYLGEARLLFGKFDVEGLVTVRDYFEENGTAYIVMDYLSGGTLRQYLERQPFKRVEDVRAAALLLPVIKALLCLHGMGIVHCDISPDNLLFDGEGKLHLIDFGAAREKGRSGERRYYKEGYAPPEQYLDRDVIGPWTDIYALCSVWYQMLTGKKIQTAPERLRSDRLRKISSMVSIAKEREEKILRGLSLDIQRRYFSVISLLPDDFSDEDFRKDISKGDVRPEPERKERETAGGVRPDDRRQKYLEDTRRQWGALWMQITTDAGGGSSGRKGKFFTLRRLRNVLAVFVGIAVMVAALVGVWKFYIYKNPVKYYSWLSEWRREDALLHPDQEYKLGNEIYDEVLSRIEKNASDIQIETGSTTYTLSENAIKKEKIVSNNGNKFYLTRDEAADAFRKIMKLEKNDEESMEYSYSSNIQKDSRRHQSLSVYCRRTETISYPNSEELEISYDPADGRVYKMEFTGSRERAEKFLCGMSRALSPENYLKEQECHYVLDYPNDSCSLGSCYASADESSDYSEETPYKDYRVTISAGLY